MFWGILAMLLWVLSWWLGVKSTSKSRPVELLYALLALVCVFLAFLCSVQSFVPHFLY